MVFRARDMTTLKALGLEVPSRRLLATYGDLLRQQPPIQWHGRRTPPGAPAQGPAAAPAPDQPNQTGQPMVDRLEDNGPAPPAEPTYAGAENDQITLLDDGQCRQIPTYKHGEAMKHGEPSGESGPSEEKAN